MTPRTSLNALIVLALAGATAALPVAAAEFPPDVLGDDRCYWNPEFSEPAEGATFGYVDFRDGEICYVWVFPCDDHSTRVCWPQ